MTPYRLTPSRRYKYDTSRLDAALSPKMQLTVANRRKSWREPLSSLVNSVRVEILRIPNCLLTGLPVYLLRSCLSAYLPLEAYINTYLLLASTPTNVDTYFLPAAMPTYYLKRCLDTYLPTCILSPVLTPLQTPK
ncbi:uncharacterized protein LAJ45_11720 [Morchella importuna]|uniref:uncharacterized protein n=1 Tax=Morchella importuna TaxID=1174673 RepID=UPI001E8EBF06|nr:uncharacterized protein LAJ45_11720 [Morchella importuna]KAH8144304.1 hypothetical protein LAJ45_11720 [Morchella importuna]